MKIGVIRMVKIWELSTLYDIWKLISLNNMVKKDCNFTICNLYKLCQMIFEIRKILSVFHKIWYWKANVLNKNYWFLYVTSKRMLDLLIRKESHFKPKENIWSCDTVKSKKIEQLFGTDPSVKLIERNWPLLSILLIGNDKCVTDNNDG